MSELVALTTVGREPAFRFGPSRAYEHLRVFAAVVCVVGGIAIAWITGSPLGLVFVAVGVLIVVRGRTLRRRGEGLVLTPTHVYAGDDALPWPAVADADVVERYAGRYTYKELRILTHPREPVLHARTEALAASAGVLCDVIRMYRDEPERRAAIGTAAECERLFG